MKFLCLAYGDETDWKALSKQEQDQLLAQDQVVRSKGALMGAVTTDVATVRAWDGDAKVTEGPLANSGLPLAGFSIIEAKDIDEVVHLVAGTPCARANGAIEIRPILMMNSGWQSGS
jgi:hypothetical protein